ncbi:insulinase family protein [Phaeovibrio sulfidiphilus]|uniref:Insulinase family protein n=1 Tax=Phaeovibrio sulfidiphilus TaxID=1220600 RepID=A0A8J6YWM7_9PROT|nr:pitrilysin family protein [Phaeovibrio sulfidiphilus]MBE1237814.1 insulinase family protein [Phaeovibrio sulfidiphilus]
MSSAVRLFPRKLLVACLGAALVLMTARAAPAQVFDPGTFELSNGLKVVVLPDHRSPVVHHMVWYRVGAADEPAGKSGLAHLLEHMMFKGTKTLAAGEFSKIIARHGGNDNAFTSDNYTAYYQSIAREHLPMVMEMEADRMVNLLFGEEDFRTELSVVREERRARTDTEPSSLLMEQMRKRLWGDYPYANPVIGWEDELVRLTREDALAFYDRFYGPDNAILIVAGDVRTEDVRPLAERTYGQLKSRGFGVRSRDRVPGAALDDTMVLHHWQVRQPSITRILVAPAQSSDPNGHVDALKVFAELLGRGPTSHLYRSLVVDRKIAVSAGAWYSAESLDYGTFGLYAIPAEGVSTETLVKELDAELARLLASGVDADEVARARHRLKAGLVYARDSLSRGAQTMGVALTTGSTVESVESWPARLDAVTVEAVEAAAKALFNPDTRRMVTGILLPGQDAEGEAAQ